MNAQEAFELFLTPPRVPEFSFEAKLLAQAASHRVCLGPNGFARGGGEEVQVYSWGESAGPAVLFVHGWGGNAANHAAGIKAVVQAGGRAVAFDAPGHGRSEGRYSSAPAFAWAIQGVVPQIGELHGIVGHSLGGSATCIALGRGVRARAAVLLAASCRVAPVLADFNEKQGFPPEFSEAVQRVAAEQFTEDEYSVEPHVARLGDIPALILHDPEDREMPYYHSQVIAAAWPGAELMEVPRAGHRSILRTQAVVAAICRHVLP